MNNEIQYIVLQKGTKIPALNKQKQRIFVKNVDIINDAGISLRDTTNIVVIDFDNLKENNGIENRVIKAIKDIFGCNLIVKTDKGFHFYFKSSKGIPKKWVKQNLVCGVMTDGMISGDNYLVIKRNGKLREHIGDIRLDNLTELPSVLLPLYTKLKYEICDLPEGSRNDTLFKHLCLIRRNYDENKDNINLEEIANFINRVIFKEPLPDNEVLNTVNSVRKQEIKKLENDDFDFPISQQQDKKDDEKNKIKILARSLVASYDIHCHNNQLFFKDNDIYINDDDKLLQIGYSKGDLNSFVINEFFFQLKMNAKGVKRDDVIKINNGAIVNNEYVSNYIDFSPFQLNVVYDENAYDEEMDKFLDTVCCNRKDMRQILEEMVGHCLMLNTFPHKFFYLYGNGSNGKSTLIECLFNFFGNMAVSVPLNMLQKENYVIRLNNKLVNISDDIDMTYLTSNQNLKGLASGSYITGRNLYEKPITFKNNATLIFVSNFMLSSKDKTYGFNRRIEMIPFEAEITEENKDPLMLEKLTTKSAKSYLLLLALKGIKRIINNGYELSKSDYIDKLTHRYIIESDSVEAFLEYGMTSIEDRKYAYVYTCYEKFCLDNDYIPCKKNGFSRRLTSKGYNTYTKKIETEDGIKKSVRYIKKVNNE